ncbi:MAG: PspC domain-containing protein [Patescibacteria group bacterium]|nr:PspC domain-containing protein [Patescibacteria group bacterium]
MKKTISINLSGQNFIIEEDAYGQLLAYLENIKQHCGAGADAAEVIADIENSMAEKLKSSLSAYKEVITVEDVESLIKIMGTIEDFNREIGGLDNENEEKTDQRIKRKLYRDPDNAVIGGVAAGLGAYFDIDPVLFRVIFCALVFAGGSGLFIYAVLWIAMPEAKAAYQKLEMRGQAPTISAFKQLAKTGKNIQEGWKKSSIWGKIFSLPLVIINGLFLAIKKLWKIFWPIIKLFFGLFLTIFSLIGLGAIGVGSLFLLLYGNSSYQLFFIPVSELTILLPYCWIILAGFLSLAIPAILFIFAGLGIIRKKNMVNFTIGAILVGIWMIAGIFFCALCLRYFPELQKKFNSNQLTNHTEQVVDMSGIKEIEARGELINISVLANQTKPAHLSGRKIDLDHIDIKKDGDKLILTEQPLINNNEICLNCNLQPVDFIIATSSSLKIKTDEGASVFDETKIKQNFKGDKYESEEEFLVE